MGSSDWRLPDSDALLRAGQLRRMTEQRLAAVVVDWLRGQHWDVWQEVKTMWAGHNEAADIMARKGRIIWVVECKLSRSLAVLDQAIWWHSFADFVSVAVPPPRIRPGCRPKHSKAWSHVLRYYGIGELVVDKTVELDTPPSLTRSVKKRWMPSGKHFHDVLDSMPQNYGTAGAKDTPRFSPFAQTRDALVGIVTKQPGILFGEVMAELQHHYSSDATARSCLLKWIREGSIPVRIEYEGRRLRLHPK